MRIKVSKVNVINLLLFDLQILLFWKVSKCCQSIYRSLVELATYKIVHLLEKNMSVKRGYMKQSLENRINYSQKCVQNNMILKLNIIWYYF